RGVRGGCRPPFFGTSRDRPKKWRRLAGRRPLSRWAPGGGPRRCRPRKKKKTTPAAEGRFPRHYGRSEATPASRHGCETERSGFKRPCYSSRSSDLPGLFAANAVRLKFEGTTTTRP